MTVHFRVDKKINVDKITESKNIAVCWLVYILCVSFELISNVIQTWYFFFLKRKREPSSSDSDHQDSVPATPSAQGDSEKKKKKKKKKEKESEDLEVSEITLWHFYKPYHT